MSTEIGAVPTEPTFVPVAPPARAEREGYGTGFWGIVFVITTESMIFLSLLASYFFLRAASKQWPPPGTELPKLDAAAWIFSALLIGSSIPIFWADAAVARNRIRTLRVALALGFVMGALFLWHTYDDFQALHFGWKDSAYGSIFYVTVGLHALHVFAGLLISAVVQIKAWRNLFSAEHHVSVEIFSLYWHFVDVVWIFVFSSLFISVHFR